MTTKPTNRPWKVNKEYEVWDIEDCTGKLLGDSDGPIKTHNKNIEYVVQAVNAYDRDQETIRELREALEKIAAQCGPHDKDWTNQDFKKRSELYEKIAKEALAKAER